MLDTKSGSHIWNIWFQAFAIKNNNCMARQTLFLRGKNKTFTSVFWIFSEEKQIKNNWKWKAFCLTGS